MSCNQLAHPHFLFAYRNGSNGNTIQTSSYKGMKQAEESGEAYEMMDTTVATATAMDPTATSTAHRIQTPSASSQPLPAVSTHKKDRQMQPFLEKSELESFV